MYNAYKHISKTFLTISIATLAFSSCKSDKAENTIMAEGLFNKAQTALHSGNAHECITLLDSLDSNFIEERAIIQQSMNLRPQALLQIATEEIATTDSIINVNKAKLDSLKPLMTHIDIPGTEVYSLVKTMVDPNFMNKMRTGRYIYKTFKNRLIQIREQWTSTAIQNCYTQFLCIVTVAIAFTCLSVQRNYTLVAYGSCLHCRT